MRRKALQHGLVGALCAVAVLLVVEGLARLAEPTLPAWRGSDGDAVIMTGHPTRLWGMTEGKRWNDGAMATINERGLRGELPELPRPEGRLRLMLTGDSTFFGHGVDEGQDMGSVAVSRLPNADLVNAAVPGYSLEQTRVLLEEEGWAMEPSVLVIGNLWSDNTFDRYRDEELLNSVRFANSNPLARSAALRILASAIGGEGDRIITVSKLQPYPEGMVRRVPVQRYAELLDLTVREAAERDVGVVLVQPANRTSIRETGHWQIYYAAMEAVAEHHGLPLVDTNALFRGTPADDLFLDLMHPTVEGHRRMGEAIAAALEDGPTLAKAEALEQVFEDVEPPLGGVEPDRSPQSRLFERDAMGEEMQVGMERWFASGEVRADGPVTVSVVVDGTVVSSSRMAKGGKFSLGVRVDSDDAILRVDGDTTQEIPISASSGPVVVEFE